MKTSKRIQIDQLGRKINAFGSVPDSPGKGWIYAIRTALSMSYRQMAKRLEITPQSIQGFEKREREGNITLRNLREIAQSLNMRLVYGFIPKSGSLEKMIEDQAYAVAQKIVMRTDATMKLEDQGITKKSRDEAILELAGEIKRKMPRYLWD
jgi:predicted DNA-binding mobile mystery protein A